MPGAPLEFHAYIFLTPRILSFFRLDVKNFFAVDGKKYHKRVDFGRAGVESVSQRRGVAGKVAVCAHLTGGGLVTRGEQGRRRDDVLSLYHRLR